MKFLQRLLFNILLCFLVGSCGGQNVTKPSEGVTGVKVEESLRAAKPDTNNKPVGKWSPETRFERTGFTVKNLVSFDNFKQRFHRVYSSLTEMVRRQKLFLSRALQVIISNIKYKLRQLSYYYSINQFSDKANGELLRRPVGDRRSVLLGGPKMQLRAPADDSKRRSTEGPKKELQAPGKWSYNSESGWVEIKEEPKSFNYISYSPNTIEYDWRYTGCFTKVKNQQNCGACYIFAIVALLEYEHCKHTGEHLTFSEQYIVDCALTHSNTGGCVGDWPIRLSPFLQKYGIDLQSDYPYTNEVQHCKYGYNSNKEKMGYLKPGITTLKPTSDKDWEHHITLGPFQVVVAPDIGFVHYGGGVYNCYSQNDGRTHAVSVVGSGKQDGIDYWILRNSWGEYWGEEGYMRMNKRSYCFASVGSTILQATLENVAPFVGKNEHYEANFHLSETKQD